jgi:hypothetical protein
MLNLGDLLQTLDDPDPQDPAVFGSALASSDTTPPTVTATSPSLAGGTLAAGTTSLAVTFSEPVVGGDLAANYQLQGLGPDALLGTADDTIISLSPAYAGNTATLTFAALPASVYRLTVRDTITDAAGNKLDGDANGTAGGDCRADFVALPAGDLFYSPATYYSGGRDPLSVAIGDLNGDGRPDLAVANCDSSNVGVLLGQSGGTFAPAATYSSGGGGPSSVAIGDLNGDGRADLAVANYSSNTVGVLLGQSGGTFAAAATYGSGGSNPGWVAIGDLNGDGRPDLAVANAASGNVGVLLGQPGGTFAPAATYSSGGTGSWFVAIGDLSGDGRPDLAVSNGGSANVGVLLGQSGGTFAPAATYGCGGIHLNAVAIGDLNGDGRPDLAAANYGYYGPGANVAVLTNTLAFPLFSPHGTLFDVQPGGFMAGQLVHGTNNAFDGLNRLQVAAVDYAPAPQQPNLQDAGRTLVLPPQTIANLQVHREITVPATGSQDFARSLDVYTNPTANPITTTVRIVGNLGSDAATTVWKTSDGDTDVETADQWIGTDDADGSGTPAIVHYIHGPSGLRPTSVVRTGDNIEWTYNITVHASETVRLASFTILSTTRAEAEAAASALAPNGFSDPKR